MGEPARALGRAAADGPRVDAGTVESNGDRPEPRVRPKKESTVSETADVLIPTHPATPARGRFSLRQGLGPSPLAIALLSAVLVWFSFPPVNAWWLGWFAPIGWIRLVSAPDGRQPLNAGRLYLVGLVHWLLMIQWIRLPHWSAYFGWLALAIYLAAYLPAFVGVSRILVHQWRWPSMVAVPVAWTGLELARSHLLTGFSMSLLGHSQLPWTTVIQLADLFGAYGVSFLMMAVAACMERLLPQSGRRGIYLGPVLAMGALMTASLAYGHFRLSQLEQPVAGERTLRVALIQGSFDTQFDGDAERPRRAFLDYMRLTEQAGREHAPLDLVVWPESMFTGGQPMMSYDEPLQLIPDWTGTVTELRQRLDEYAESARSRAAWIARRVKSPLLVGIEWAHWKGVQEQRFNSAVLFDLDGQVLKRYDKMHRVMFGEYVPLGGVFPWLYRLTPMRDGLTPGDKPQAMEVSGVRIAPTICFENTVPHLVRRQCRELAEKGQSPHLLVTVTNDGWFWGSSLLDVHLACGVFRALEMRRPLLIAANTGFSAWVDPTGSIRAQGPRRAEGVVLATVGIRPAPIESPYYLWGDWAAGACLFVVIVALLRPLVGRILPATGSNRPRMASVPGR